MSNEISDIVKGISTDKMTLQDVPKELELQKDIVRAERKKGLRIEKNRGYDVIKNEFFVEEELLHVSPFCSKFRYNKIRFDKFSDYFDFLDGDIYSNACYRFIDFDKYKRFIKKKKIDVTRMKKQDAFIDYSISDKKAELASNHNGVELRYKVTKAYISNEFKSRIRLLDDTGKSIDRFDFRSHYFFDFVHFLEGDLSEAILIDCDGLMNIKSIAEINMQNARLTSFVCEHFGIEYEPLKVDESLKESFNFVKENERLHENVNATETEGKETTSEYSDIYRQRIHYITDMHLLHKVIDLGCKSKNDVIYMFNGILGDICTDLVVDFFIDSFCRKPLEMLLIGGDVCSDFEIYTSFIKRLSRKIDTKHTYVVFILGNHELWSFPNEKLNDIVDKYRNHIESNGMYFIHNELLYKDSDGALKKISYSDLVNKDTVELRMQLRKSEFVILGGVGFSGYNDKFNADYGIYRNVLNREEEIAETRKFEDLYNKLIPVIHDKNTVILTHMPRKDWCREDIAQKEFIYVSGHTHKNYFYDDGDCREYADNQIGYGLKPIGLKSFLIGSDYDIFTDISDGIHEISTTEYQDFYRGMNISMTFTRKGYSIYLLKRNGHYMFICRNGSGGLCIMNGGQIKRLEIPDIEYYYEHMNGVIETIEEPLRKYTVIQEYVAECIRKIGGSGRIHGCIVDINFFNHVYVNPFDLKVTAYWARDIVDKVTYPDIATLLEAKCPQLYSNYLEVVRENSEFGLVKSENTGLVQKYTSTDIYAVSRELKKIQKLQSNILSAWYDVPDKKNAVDKNTEVRLNDQQQR